VKGTATSLRLVAGMRIGGLRNPPSGREEKIDYEYELRVRVTSTKDGLRDIGD